MRYAKSMLTYILGALEYVRIHWYTGLEYIDMLGMIGYTGYAQIHWYIRYAMMGYIVITWICWVCWVCWGTLGILNWNTLVFWAIGYFGIHCICRNSLVFHVKALSDCPMWNPALTKSCKFGWWMGGSIIFWPCACSILKKNSRWDSWPVIFEGVIILWPCACSILKKKF